MPSSTAIQHKTIVEKSYSDFIERLDFGDITELIESGKLDELKHSILYLIIKNWFVVLLLIRAPILP